MEMLGIVGVAAGAVAIPLAAVSTATSVAAISQGTSAQQAGAQGGGGAEPKDDPRLAKFSLRASCDAAGKHLDGKIVVLRNRKLYLDDSDPAHRTFDDGHPFSGFYLDYPDAKALGLVSTISKDPPELNWIYADNDTLELKYGNKTASKDHIHAPWDWTDDQGALMLEDWEGFVALEESPGVWSVNYDQDEDHLQEIHGKTRCVVEISLQRRVLKQPGS
ncbi:hypothetical protein B0H17DRAFT_1119707 [Mycena rosella]|uniref:Uncharacterized protein n=1 Tax=Mycena rosella TaxID=1033263 RepID=A0AAD7B0B1_MYCRO|nr:hypothetical protein B0H17DRAFT_1119707 [Mycena rosella]